MSCALIDCCGCVVGLINTALQFPHHPPSPYLSGTLLLSVYVMERLSPGAVESSSWVVVFLVWC